MERQPVGGLGRGRLAGQPPQELRGLRDLDPKPLLRGQQVMKREAGEIRRAVSQTVLRSRLCRASFCPLISPENRLARIPGFA